MTESAAVSDKKRNYQLDAVKLLLAMLIFTVHTSGFIRENTNFSIPEHLGFICNHAFFVIAGFLMVYGTRNKVYDISNAGKLSLDFIINKFKGFASKYYAALLIAIILYIYIYIYRAWIKYFIDLINIG